MKILFFVATFFVATLVPTIATSSDAESFITQEGVTYIGIPLSEVLDYSARADETGYVSEPSKFERPPCYAGNGSRRTPLNEWQCGL